MISTAATCDEITPIGLNGWGYPSDVGICSAKSDVPCNCKGDPVSGPYCVCKIDCVNSKSYSTDLLDELGCSNAIAIGVN